MNIYGIPNCNTVKKALDWLKANKVDYTFIDFKKAGITPDKLKEWHNRVGYENFLNKQGLTWRQLPPEEKEKIVSATEALALLQQKTSMIKRPVIEDGDFLFFGFDDVVYKQHFNQ